MTLCCELVEIRLRCFLGQGWGMVRKEKPRLGPGKLMEQLAPWETFQVLGPHSGVDISDSVMIKRYKIVIV